MRHGQANPQASSDAERPLTGQGHLEAKVMAKWLVDSNISFDHLYVSPFVRAQQTATGIIDNINCTSPITTLPFITPSGSASEVHDFIDGVCNVDKPDGIFIVSHMPLVSYLVAELTFDHRSPIFQTAAIAQIDYNVKTMKGQLVKMISPYDLV